MTKEFQDMTYIERIIECVMRQPTVWERVFIAVVFFLGALIFIDFAYDVYKTIVKSIPAKHLSKTRR